MRKNIVLAVMAVLFLGVGVCRADSVLPIKIHTKYRIIQNTQYPERPESHYLSLELAVENLGETDLPSQCVDISVQFHKAANVSDRLVVDQKYYSLNFLPIPAHSTGLLWTALNFAVGSSSSVSSAMLVPGEDYIMVVKIGNHAGTSLSGFLSDGFVSKEEFVHVELPVSVTSDHIEGDFNNDGKVSWPEVLDVYQNYVDTSR